MKDISVYEYNKVKKYYYQTIFINKSFLRKEKISRILNKI